MTEQEFIDRYCAKSKIAWAKLEQLFVVLPCNCDYENCHGWVMVSNKPDAIRIHNELYMPA